MERKHQTRRPQTNGRCRLIAAAASLLLKDTTAAWAASSDARVARVLSSSFRVYQCDTKLTRRVYAATHTPAQEMICVLHFAGKRCVRTLEAREIL